MSNYVSKMTKQEKLNVNRFKTMSAKIRYLNHKGYKPSAIKSELNIIYQWVNNVLKNEVKNPKEKFKI